ncbi:nuclear transport factor 2 family protein [Streptomyces gardneri]|nr:nuclear transport factor 2 family protein [Streptomyces gardneri]
MEQAVDVVREFCALMERREAEALRPFLADSAVYQNVGMPAVSGVDAIVRNLHGQFAMYPDAYAYEIVNIVGNGSIVMTERLDYIQAPDGRKPGVPVMGTFVVGDDGKITRWTDYWDTALPAKLRTGEDVSALLPATSGAQHH